MARKRKVTVPASGAAARARRGAPAGIPPLRGLGGLPGLGRAGPRMVTVPASGAAARARRKKKT